MSTCIGKKGWDTAEDARQALHTIRSSPDAWKVQKVPVRYYACDICGKYHLTAMKSQADSRKKISKRGRRGR